MLSYDILNFIDTTKISLYKFWKTGASVGSDIRRVSGEKDITELELNELQTTFMNKVRLHEALIRRFNLMTGDVYDINAWAHKEYDMLCSIPLVLDVQVRGRTISVFTDTIYIKHLLLNFDMGKFRIDIYNGGYDRDSIKIFKVSGGKIVHGDLIHPHIHDDGRCCFGNIREGAIKLVRTNQYAVLTQLLIQYLQSYNSTSPYANIFEWG